MEEQNILKNFGLNCKIQRMKLNMSQDDVVEKTGFSKSYISNVETAKCSISLVNATKFAKVYNKGLEELLKEVP